MSEKAPLVSVIIPCYNRSKLISETINSVTRQTYTNYEIIVVDDGSTDNTQEIINNLKSSEERIFFYYRDRLPKGASTCRNIGLDKAKGKYVIFLDSDDILSPWCIKGRVVRMEQNASVDFMVYNAAFFRHKLGDFDKKYYQFSGDVDHLTLLLNGHNIWPVLGIIWKTTSICKVGGFEEALKARQILELNIRALLAQLNYIFYDEIDCYVRVATENSISKSNKLTLEMVKNREILLRKLLNLLYTKGIHIKYRSSLCKFFVSAFTGYIQLKKQTEAKQFFEFFDKELKFSSKQKVILQMIAITSRLHNVRGSYRVERLLTSYL